MTGDSSSPAADPDAEEARLRGLAEERGQQHVFRFWGELNTAERGALLAQLGALDFDLIDRLARAHPDDDSPGDRGALEPAPIITVPACERERQRLAEARERGEDLLREGRVAAFVVAGGQGTRLGFDGPKGAFEIGPVSRRCLFQLHAEKILALSKRYGVTIPWYVMTSEANHEATAQFFRRRAHFGLEEENVRFFQQEMLPAVDRQGRFFLESKHRVFTSPNGHGGSLKALHESRSLEDMRSRGVDTVFYFQVDNPLISVCDPAFLGFHALADSEMSSKVVRKAGWDEKVGVIGLRGGKLTVIEYSDLPEADARATRPDGSLKYWAGSIAIHVLSTGFVERLNRGGFRLPYHRAEKKIPYLDEAGRECRPAERNGIKFETFVFDALSEARRPVTVEVRREDEFSPVKNALGQDSPEEARKDMTALYLRWLEACGARAERREDGSFQGCIEISPLTALDPVELGRRVKPGTLVRDGFTL